MTSKIGSNSFKIADRIEPTQTNPNSAHYEDTGFFQADLKFIAPPKSETTLPTTPPIESLTDVLVSEAMRQLKVQEISKKEAQLGRPLTTTESYQIRGKDLWERLDANQQHHQLHNIASSTVNRPDIEATISIDDRQKFTTFHEFCHNSSMNGKQYYDAEGKLVTISHAITASEDRLADRICMLRRVSREDRSAIAYTGRPETLKKAENQAEWMFAQERQQPYGKGIEPTGKRDAQGRPIFRFTYVVDSLLSSAIFYDRKNPERHEQQIVEGEIAALNALRENQEGTVVIDPTTGRECRVLFSPILLQNPINWGVQVNDALPDWMSHRSSEKAIAKKGIEQLKAYALEYRKGLDQTEALGFNMSSLKERLDQVIPLLDDFQSYRPEKKMVVLSLVGEALHLPFVIHCMSSKDRTGISIALISAFDQFRKMGHFKGDIDAMLKEETFKELFCANLMIGHSITNYGRGAQGEFMGEQLGDLWGYEVGHNKAFLRLLPMRYLKDNHKFLKALKTYPLFFIAAIGVALAGFYGTLVRSIQERNPLHFVKHIAYGWIVDFVRVLANAHKVIPSNKLIKDIPAVAERHLKKQKATYPLTQAFKARFDQIENMDHTKWMTLFQNPNPSAAGLSEDEKNLIVFLNQERDVLEKMLQVKVLSQQIPLRARQFIAEALKWDMLRFDTADNATQKKIVGFFQSGGSWTVEVPAHEIENQSRPYSNETALEHQFNKDFVRMTPTLIDGVLIESDNPFRTYLEQLVQKGVAREQALKILSACQQGGHFRSLMMNMKHFTHLHTRGIHPAGGVNLIPDPDEKAQMHANIITTAPNKIVLVSPYVFEEKSGIVKHQTFELTLDSTTDTATAQFTITDKGMDFKPPRTTITKPVASPVQNEYRLVKLWKYVKNLY
jgi:hypothetical protein